MKNYTIKPEYMDNWGADANENTIVTQDDVERFAADWEKPVDELMKQLEEAPTEKTITYLDREIELTSVLYRYGIGAEPQEGIYVHDTTDEFGDGDAIYGNGWKLEDIHDASDVESLIASGDCSSYIVKNGDGTYTMDADNEETLWDGYDPENNHVFFVIDHLGHVWVCRRDGRELWNDEYYTEDGLEGLRLAILNEGYRLS